MQKPFFNRQLMSLALSVLMTVSATATAGVLSAQKTPAPAKKEAPKQQSAPAGDKTSDKATDKLSEKEKAAAAAKEFQASLIGATSVEPLELLKNPQAYLNKKVTFTGTFNRFADIGLDYKKAFRDSRDYVTFFILRPDVTEHTIPLSEMKLFFPRKKSDEVMNLESGDKIQVVGTEFSTALEEPWVDIEHIKILEKTTKPERKHEPEF